MLVSWALGTNLSFSQVNPKLESLLGQAQQYIDKADTLHDPDNRLLLYMDFNSPVIKNLYVINVLKNAVIEKVELVYTSYRLSETFSQPKLNRERLLNLNRLFPDLFKSDLIKWSFSAQTVGKNETEAKKLFHGFIITFRERPSEATMKTEVSYLKDLINNDSLGKDTTLILPVLHVKKKRVRTTYYVPNWAYKRHKGVLYDKPGIWGRKPYVITQYDTTVKMEKVERFFPSTESWKYLAKIQDSTVFAVLNRNKSWKDMAFVCDVTGSMSPYSAQLIIWNKLNFHLQRGKYFTFFNDGDNLADEKKVTGKTGGIYHLEASSVKQIENTAITAMVKGWGGDIPENYMEALLASVKRFPEAGSVVLVADNWSSIKDICLLYLLKVPVHVILCGVEDQINPDFIKLAIKTKGSIHTLQQDFTNLSALKEGQLFTLGNQTFQMKNGNIRLVSAL